VHGTLDDFPGSIHQANVTFLMRLVVMRGGLVRFRALGVRVVSRYRLKGSMTFRHRSSTRGNTLIVGVFFIFVVWNRGRRLNSSVRSSKALCLQLLRAHGSVEALRRQ
jgi:hypothetical protein